MDINLPNKIKSEINKIIKIKGHILYDQYSDFPLLKDCNSDFLKKNFSQWLDQENFLPGLYNLTRFMDKDETIESIKARLVAVETSLRFKKSYYIPDEKFYAINPRIVNPWANFCIQIKKRENCDFDDSLISLSRLKEFEMERPNLIVYDGIFNDLDRKETKKLIKEKLIIKPIKYEKYYFML